MHSYSKDDTTNFNDNFVNTVDFKSSKYKAKLVGEINAQPKPNNNNEILQNASVAVPWKYLSKFWRSPEMSLIKCKVELKLKLAKHCVLAVADIDNANDNDIIFTIKDTKLDVPVVISSAEDNQKLSRVLSKGFEISVYWIEYEIKGEN